MLCSEYDSNPTHAAHLMGSETPRIAGVAEVAGLATKQHGREMTRRRAWQLTQTRAFPDPIQVLAMGPVWLESEVREFLETPRKPGRQPRKTSKPATDN